MYEYQLEQRDPEETFPESEKHLPDPEEVEEDEPLVDDEDDDDEEDEKDVD